MLNALESRVFVGYAVLSIDLPEPFVRLILETVSAYDVIWLDDDNEVIQLSSSDLSQIESGLAKMTEVINGIV